MYKFPIRWNLSDSNFTKDKGKVFSCFSGGGGSTMGYKLSGFDVIGNNEWDEKMNEIYLNNHKPLYNYHEDIRTFRVKKLPKALYELDILDGSPPCSAFSIAGDREESWGEEKKHATGGGKVQTVDDLFFEFIELTKELQPKVVISENVKGLTFKNAKKYLYKIQDKFDEAGYHIQYWVLNASNMGVPQKRERVFFVGLRKDLVSYVKSKWIRMGEPKLPVLNLHVGEPPIPFKEVYTPFVVDNPLYPLYQELWQHRLPTDPDFADINTRVRGKNRTGFGTNFIHMDKVCNTITTKVDCCCLYDEPRFLSNNEFTTIGTFPQDFDFCRLKPYYVVGRSVPPVMMAHISSMVYDQWLSKINEEL